MAKAVKKEAAIVVGDLETTGLLRNGITDPLKQPGITQVGLVVLDRDMNEIDAFESLVNPEIDDKFWEPGAIKITGIGPEKVKDAPTFFEVFHEIADRFFGVRVWSGYNNNGFDTKVLKYQLERYGFDCNFPWPPIHVDVMDLSLHHMEQQGKRGIKRPKLAEIYKHLFDEEFDGAHNALIDVRATVRVLRELGKDRINAIFK